MLRPLLEVRGQRGPGYCSACETCEHLLLVFLGNGVLTACRTRQMVSLLGAVRFCSCGIKTCSLDVPFGY